MRFRRCSPPDRSILIERGKFDSRIDQRETQHLRDRVSRGVHPGTQLPVSAVPTEQRDVENQLCVEIYCSVQPRPPTVNFDNGLVNLDPRRLRCRRVGNPVRQPTHPIPNHPMRAPTPNSARTIVISRSEHPVAWSRTVNALTQSQSARSPKLLLNSRRRSR